MKMLRCFFIG